MRFDSRVLNIGETLSHNLVGCCCSQRERGSTYLGSFQGCGIWKGYVSRYRHGRKAYEGNAVLSTKTRKDKGKCIGNQARGLTISMDQLMKGAKRYIIC